MGGLDFRGSGSKLWTLSASNDVTKRVHDVVSRAGRAKRCLSALHHRNRHWLRTMDGGWDNDLLVAARFNDPPSGAPEEIGTRSSLAVVAANFLGTKRKRATFRLTSESAARLDDNTRYMAFDYMSKDRDRWLWAGPRTGAEIKAQGVYVA